MRGPTMEPNPEAVLAATSATVLPPRSNACRSWLCRNLLRSSKIHRTTSPPGSAARLVAPREPTALHARVFANESMKACVQPVTHRLPAS